MCNGKRFLRLLPVDAGSRSAAPSAGRNGDRALLANRARASRHRPAFGNEGREIEIRTSRQCGRYGRSTGLLAGILGRHGRDPGAGLGAVGAAHDGNHEISRSHWKSPKRVQCDNRSVNARFRLFRCRICGAPFALLP